LLKKTNSCTVSPELVLYHFFCRGVPVVGKLWPAGQIFSML